MSSLIPQWQLTGLPISFHGRADRSISHGISSGSLFRMQKIHCWLIKIHKYDNGYFQTMVVRLHNFDGSMTMPSSAEYINYTIRLPGTGESAEATGYSRVITEEKTVNISGTDNPLPLSPEGAELLPTSYTALFSDRPDQPVQNVPAYSITGWCMNPLMMLRLLCFRNLLQSPSRVSGW